MNSMKKIKIEKVTLNVCTGINQETLKKGIKLIKNLTTKSPVKTLSKKRIPAWNLRPGLPIGSKLTLRKKEAEDILKRLLQTKDNKLKKSCFDTNGNVSFGLHEYIEIPGMPYDPEIGIIGFQVCVTLERPGFCIKKRKIKKRKIPKTHRITQEESIDFFQKEFDVQLEAD
ncbi:50S ribosomal protein L5 [Candidatus Woesearchaeota archaeon]|nr:50S ribosomal protein L5 [Candidatus Woesearchaeota archaeon]